MKYILAVVSFCLCVNNMIFSFECDRGEPSSELLWCHDRKYICYEFGFSNLVDIYVVDGDSICDVIIYDGKGNCVSTTCQKSPIIKWAFDDMTNEITMPSVKLDKNFKPFYYKLSILNAKSQSIIDESTLLIDYSDEVNEKITELKALMIRLWYSNCIK